MNKYIDLTKIVRHILRSQPETRSDDFALYAAVIAQYDSDEKPSKATVRKAKYRVVSLSPELAGDAEEKQITRYRKTPVSYRKKFTESGISIRCVETNISFDSVQEAAQCTGVSASSIYKCVEGEINTAGGYHWEHEKTMETLCFACQKACGGRDCPWANHLDPVCGWRAIPVRRVYSWKIETSYTVTSCPLFEPD